MKHNIGGFKIIVYYFIILLGQIFKTTYYLPYNLLGLRLLETLILLQIFAQLWALQVLHDKTYLAFINIDNLY